MRMPASCNDWWRDGGPSAIPSAEDIFQARISAVRAKCRTVNFEEEPVFSKLKYSEDGLRTIDLVLDGCY